MYFYIDIYKDKIWKKNTINKKTSERIILYCLLVFFEYKNLINKRNVDLLSDNDFKNINTDINSNYPYIVDMDNKDLCKCIGQKLGIDFLNIYLNISYVNEEQIKQYNQQYRGIDKPTNVLSFTNQNTINILNFNNDCVSKNISDFKTLYLGDMILCYEKLKQEANEYNKTFNERLLHLFVHSIFHLFGLDHEEKKDRELMESMEKSVLSILHITDIYFYTEKKE